MIYLAGMVLKRDNTDTTANVVAVYIGNTSVKDNRSVSPTEQRNLKRVSLANYKGLLEKLTGTKARELESAFSLAKGYGDSLPNLGEYTVWVGTHRNVTCRYSFMESTVKDVRVPKKKEIGANITQKSFMVSSEMDEKYDNLDRQEITVAGVASPDLLNLFVRAGSNVRCTYVPREEWEKEVSYLALWEPTVRQPILLAHVRGSFYLVPCILRASEKDKLVPLWSIRESDDYDLRPGEMCMVAFVTDVKDDKDLKHPITGKMYTRHLSWELNNMHLAYPAFGFESLMDIQLLNTNTVFNRIEYISETHLTELKHKVLLLNCVLDLNKSEKPKPAKSRNNGKSKK